MKKYVALYKNNRAAGKPSLLLEPVYKELNLATPVCNPEYLGQAINVCEAASCLHPIEFMGVKMWQEVLIAKRSEDTCLIKTPEKTYTVKKIRWADFSKAFQEVLSADSADSFQLLQEVGARGATKRKKIFVDSGLKCEFDIFYQFKISQLNLQPSESFKMDRDGMATKKIGTEDIMFFSEAGKTYKKIDPKKSVFFYPKVKFIEDAKANDQKACSKIVNLLPYVLEQMDQVEFLPPDQL